MKTNNLNNFFLSIIFSFLLSSCSSTKIAKESNNSNNSQLEIEKQQQIPELSVSSTKIEKEYENFNNSQLEIENKQLSIELSYLKVEYYLNNVRKGKSRYSLATISDKKLKSIFEYAPNDYTYKKEWRAAVDKYIIYENENSPQIKKHRTENYKIRFNSKEERDLYYKKYTKLKDELKYKNLDEFNYYHDNLNSKLNKMWLNRGLHLLNHYKTKNLIIPTDWINYKDLRGIEKELTYVDLINRIEYVERRIIKIK